MTKKVITPASGSAQTIYYETNDDNTVVKFSAGGRTVTSHAKTDSFGRKVFDELQLGTDFVSRQFVYHAGKVTTEHKDKAKVKSSATTQLVSQIILSDGRTLSYEYDAEERITSITEKYTVDKVETTDTTSYTYDALGQLLTETNVVQTIDRSEEEPVVTVTSKLVNSMEYDNYGNIKTKNGIAYTYDNTCKDLLLQVGTGDNSTISYDDQGNPLTYLGDTLTWEKGRQLKKFVKSDGTVIDYTYNANGIRTSKNVNGVLHTYTLDGTKILRETWDGNTLVPLYDNEDGVCGILYNNVPYYFIKNLQGDVIAIVDKDARTVARYSYDAWGAITSAVTYTELTENVEIATVNPFRYRGYYYDAEIAKYYLQSRYYDAKIGRFINTDTAELLLSTENSISSNLYAYCLNNIVNNEDKNGYDAIWLQANDSVMGLGHTGLAFQYEKKWYYWYWGASTWGLIAGYLTTLVISLLRKKRLVGILLRIASTTVFANCKIEKISDKSTLSTSKALTLSNKHYDSKTKFINAFYIKGDFNKAYSYFKTLKCSRNYNLLKRNCMQTTCIGLNKGKYSKNNSKNHLKVNTAKNLIVPNFAYAYLKKQF